MILPLTAFTKALYGLYYVSSPFLSSPDLVGLAWGENFGDGGLKAHTHPVPLLFLPLHCISPRGAMSEVFQEDTPSSRCFRKLEHEALGNHLPSEEKETPLVTMEITRRNSMGNKAFNADD